MNVCRIASTAATQILNTLRLRALGKLFEGASRQLDSLHLIGKLRHPGEAGSCSSNTERRGLRGHRDGDPPYASLE